MTETRIPPRALVLLIGLTLGWGLAWPIMKFIVSEISPWTFRGIMAPLSAVTLALIAHSTKGGLAPPKGQWGSMILAGLFSIFGWLMLSAISLTLIGAGHATILAYTMPLFAFLFGLVLLGERPSVKRFAGLVLGIAGVLVLVSGEFGSLKASPLGTILMLCSAVVWGLGTVIQKKAAWPISAWAVAAWMMILGGLPIIVVALLVEGPPKLSFSWGVWLALLYMLLVPTIYCYYAFVTIITLVPITVSSVGILMTPVVGVVTSNWMLGEPLGWREAGSLALICGAMGLVLTTPGKGFRLWRRRPKNYQ